METTAINIADPIHTYFESQQYCGSCGSKHPVRCRLFAQIGEVFILSESFPPDVYCGIEKLSDVEKYKETWLFPNNKKQMNRFGRIMSLFELEDMGWKRVAN